MSTSLVIDTDIGSDVDDAIALALAVRHPEIDLHAVTTVSSQPALRARLAARLLAIAGASDVVVAAGRSVPGDDRNMIGAEHRALLDDAPVDDVDRATRDAAELLAQLPADTSLVTIGQLSNVAAALAADASLPERVAELTVMGGSFAPFRDATGAVHGHERDWNLVLDPEAAIASLSAGWRLRYVPIDVTFSTVLPRRELERLRAGDDLCGLLADLVDGWRARALPSSAPSEVAALLHDPLAVACAAGCDLVGTQQARVGTTLDERGLARTVMDRDQGRDALVVRNVDAPAFASWLVDTLLGRT